MSVPALRLFEGIANMKPPEASVCDDDVYPPPDIFTVPVGVAPEPVTVAVTLRLCPELMLLEAGATVTVGVRPTNCVTVTVFDPLAAA